VCVVRAPSCVVCATAHCLTCSRCVQEVAAAFAASDALDDALAAYKRWRCAVRRVVCCVTLPSLCVCYTLVCTHARTQYR
jgi:hypothetical protein